MPPLRMTSRALLEWKTGIDKVGPVHGSLFIPREVLQMSGNGNSGSERREKRSTRLGIALLIAIAVLIIAVVWGVQNWDDDSDGPSVHLEAPVALMSNTWFAAA